MNQQAIMQAGTLLEKYVANYTDRYGVRPQVNVVNDKWKLHDVIVDIGYEETRALFAFYFQTEGSHDLRRFFNNYDQLYEYMQLQRRDRERTQKLLAESELRSKRDR